MTADRRRAAFFLALLALFLLLRLVTLGRPPFFDTTEGRYASIGREMAESGDWITPTLHGGDPFWAKPPLHFWMTALSFRLFGLSEWAGRLPGFLSAVAILLLAGRLGVESDRGARTAAALLLLGTSALFYLLAGALLLDVTFTATVTGALVSFLLSRREGRRRWAYLFFLFLGLGLLAKGPVALVLVFLPIVLASVARRGVADLRALPLLRGSALAFAVAAPWYFLAERATPGFWNYFFVHEHFLRYVRKEYGDLYGHGHVSPYGLIWILGFVAFLPWTPSLLAALRRRWSERTRGAPWGEESFLWIWGLAPLLFFTFSRSLSLPYVLPSLPPLALLAGRYAGAGKGEWRGGARSFLFAPLLLAGAILYAWRVVPLTGGEARLLLVALLPAVVLLLLGVARRSFFLTIAAASALFPSVIVPLSLDTPAALERGNSTRHLARAVASAPGGASTEEVFFLGAVPPSAEFYFHGRARTLGGGAEALGRDALRYAGKIVLLRKSREEYLPREIRSILLPIGRSGEYAVCRIVPHMEGRGR